MFPTIYMLQSFVWMVFFFFKSKLLLDLGMCILIAINKSWMIGSMYFSMATPASHAALHFWKRPVLFEGEAKICTLGWASDQFTFSDWVKYTLAMKQNNFKVMANYWGTEACIAPSTSAETFMANSPTKHKASWFFVHRSSVTPSNVQHHTPA